MIATLSMLISGILGAISNLCMRQSIDREGSARAFIVYQLLFTFIVVLLLHAYTENGFHFSYSMAFLGFLGGLAFGLMKIMLIKALEKGRASLTFAAVNSVSVLPAFFITLFYGAFLDFSYTPLNYIGAALVVFGLFWAGYIDSEASEKRSWILFALTACLFQGIFLLFMQMHALFWKRGIPAWLITFLPEEEPHAACFAPTIFAAAAGMHIILYLVTEKRLPYQREMYWGVLGGLFNGACTFFFLHAANHAVGNENLYIFPLFSVTIIIFCNLWSSWLYKERVHWRANALCLLGLVIGS